MEAELTGLERAVIACLLARKHSVTDALRYQADRCRVASREFTGVGFYTTLEVPSDAPPAAVRSGRMTLGDVTATIDGLNHGAGFVLWIEDGVLRELEGFSYDEPWPEAIRGHEVRAGGVEHDGTRTDLQEIDASWVGSADDGRH
jgi:hypothetical protein